MKTKSRKLKAVAALLSGGMLLGSGGDCVPDNFWISLVDTAGQTAVGTAVGDVVLDALNPPAPEAAE